MPILGWSRRRFRLPGIMHTFIVAVSATTSPGPGRKNHSPSGYICWWLWYNYNGYNLVIFVLNLVNDQDHIDICIHTYIYVYILYVFNGKYQLLTIIFILIHGKLLIKTILMDIKNGIISGIWYKYFKIPYPTIARWLRELPWCSCCFPPGMDRRSSSDICQSFRACASEAGSTKIEI